MKNRGNSPSRKTFVVLEGLSGSGKTAIGQSVAEKVGARFYRTPAPLFETVRGEIDRKANPTARFFFYLAGVIQASSEISNILEHESVICDRYLLTTLCYHRALNLSLNVPDSLFDSLLKPDYTFLIICEEDKRIQRLYDRGLSFNDVQERHLRIEQRFLAEYRKYSLVEIDNSNDDPNVAVDTILRFIR